MEETLNILLIDDDDVDRMTVVRLLRKCMPKIELCECTEGRMGLARAGREIYDCILVDYHLPDMSGLELLDDLRQQTHSSPAVIMLTGEGSEMVAVEAMKRGAHDYLPKGHIDAGTMKKSLLGAVEKSKLQRQLVERTRQLEESVAELRRKGEEIESYANIVSRDLREKEILLREVYHRVKNNLQVIQSLLNLSARRIRSEEAREVFETVTKRVRVIAAVHERLYRMPDLAHLSLPDYLRDVIEGAIESSLAGPDRVQLEISVDEIPLALEYAVALGLMVHELVSNCVKHGMAKGRPGKISVQFKRQENGVHFSCHDNGRGLPESFDPRHLPSMGMQLAMSFAHQLGGDLRFSNQDGCCIEADFSRI